LSGLLEGQNGVRSRKTALVIHKKEAVVMTEKEACAQFDSWMAAQHFAQQSSVPDREMLQALLNCDVEWDKDGFLFLVQPHGPVKVPGGVKDQRLIPQAATEARLISCALEVID